MEPGRLFFDPTCHGGNMLFLGNNDSLFRGSRSVINLEESSKRRPFFSNSDELYDEEYYDEQSSEKKRRLSLEQVHMLEKSFEMDNKLEPERKTQLSKKLGLQPRQVAVWFQNRRARWKTKTLEKDYDQLKSSYKSILSSYDSLQKENEKLKIEFLSLTEKLQVKQAKGSGLTSGDTLDAPFLFVDIKVEDRLSTGGGRSGVLDEEGPQQLVDCGDSYFPSHECIAAPIVNSEEDDGSDDGQNYFSNVFVEAEDHQQEDEVEPLGWWDWS